MNRPDHAEKQLRVMQQLDEDHTLTQLANAWVNLVMVCKHIFFCLGIVYFTGKKGQRGIWKEAEHVCSSDCPHFPILHQGGSKIREAHLIFQDFSEKYPATCMILRGKAQCLMHMGKFEEAEGLLLESLNKVSSNRLS